MFLFQEEIAQNVYILCNKLIDTKSGEILGPRGFNTGKSSETTGGHTDPENGSSKNLIGNSGPKEGVVYKKQSIKNNMLIGTNIWTHSSVDS